MQRKEQETMTIYGKRKTKRVRRGAKGGNKIIVHPLKLFFFLTKKKERKKSVYCIIYEIVCRVYFFPQLIKTHNLPPNRNYIFGYHPHGIFCFGAFCNFSTEATGFSKKFPGIKPSLATLAGNFRLPLLRDYLMSGGEEARPYFPVA